MMHLRQDEGNFLSRRVQSSLPPCVLHFLTPADLAPGDQLPANDRIVLSMTARIEPGGGRTGAACGRGRPHCPIIEMTFAFSSHPLRRRLFRRLQHLSQQYPFRHPREGLEPEIGSAEQKS